MTQNLFAIADLLEKINAIASEGLEFAENPYDRARYEKMQGLVIQETAQAFDIEIEHAQKLFQASLGTQTPKCGADAAVMKNDGALLVLRRAGEGSWCLPCGWVDMGESFMQAAVRETYEETGLRVTPRGTIFLGRKGPDLGNSLVHHTLTLTLMEPVPNETQVTLSHEHTEYKWIHAVSEIDHWFSSHDDQAQRALAFNIDSDSILPF